MTPIKKLARIKPLSPGFAMKAPFNGINKKPASTRRTIRKRNILIR
jgi:hypothetical protein